MPAKGGAPARRAAALTGLLLVAGCGAPSPEQVVRESVIAWHSGSPDDLAGVLDVEIAGAQREAVVAAMGRCTIDADTLEVVGDSDRERFYGARAECDGSPAVYAGRLHGDGTAWSADPAWLPGGTATAPPPSLPAELVSLPLVR